MPRECGFLNLYKISGPTSYDCIRALRRIYKSDGIEAPRMGHLGTLDPVAEGVLPIAIGSATRLIRFFKANKIYLAKIRFGMTTDTDDIQGETLSEGDTSGLTEERISDALERFTGIIEQVPPRFSAAMSDGVRAYKRARKGEDFSLKPKNVFILKGEIISWDTPNLDVRFTVGPGTYIRSIARDIGESLGVGGCLAALVREADGSFLVSEAVDISVLEKEGVEGIRAKLMPPDFILEGWPRVELNRDGEISFMHGKILSDIELPAESMEGYYAVYGTGGFIGVGVESKDGRLKANRVIKING